MDKIVYYTLTIEGHQELIIQRINLLKWQRDCICETMDAMFRRSDELNITEDIVTVQQMEGELRDVERALTHERNRLSRLRGYDEKGLPL